MGAYICSNCGQCYDKMPYRSTGEPGCLRLLIIFILFIIALCCFWPLAVIALLLILIFYRAPKVNKNYCPNCMAENKLMPLDTEAGHETAAKLKIAQEIVQKYVTAAEDRRNGGILFNKIVIIVITCFILFFFVVLCVN